MQHVTIASLGLASSVWMTNEDEKQKHDLQGYFFRMQKRSITCIKVPFHFINFSAWNINNGRHIKN